MHHQGNIRELERLTNIFIKDISSLPNQELSELKSFVSKVYLHIQFEETFRANIKKRESVVV